MHCSQVQALHYVCVTWWCVHAAHLGEETASLCHPAGPGGECPICDYITRCWLAQPVRSDSARAYCFVLTIICPAGALHAVNPAAGVLPGLTKSVWAPQPPEPQRLFPLGEEVPARLARKWRPQGKQRFLAALPEQRPWARQVPKKYMYACAGQKQRLLRPIGSRFESSQGCRRLPVTRRVSFLQGELWVA